MIALVIALTAAAPTASINVCVVDRRTVLALPYATFDQKMDGGWRAVAARAECTIDAADLIKEYREQQDAESRSLAWHEAQLRAEAGQKLEAIQLMHSALKPAFQYGRSNDDWNAYVSATIAFLRGDRPAIVKARARLAAYPDPPADYVFIDVNGVQKRGKPAGWPYNLDVVDGFLNCFGRPYREAYGADCRRPRAPTSASKQPTLETK